ncbi:MAG TPA: PP2C family protein-serine/threonine phosphatase [Bacteroidota bacterium]|nr:PP2C family protein-serine/threonine phosphatase [Bacteroidota bacterium]
MHVRKLYRTIETIGSKKFDREENFLRDVLTEIVQNEEIMIKGGRIWKLNSRGGSYDLFAQVGEVEQIKTPYRILVSDYPLFLELPKVRTIIGDEHDEYLRNRGIHHYSATGIGPRVSVNGHTLFQYVMAFNADELNDKFTATLNIIGSAVTAALATRKSERRTKILEQDIDKAREIQRSILPEHEKRFNKYELYGVSVPDRIVGGDFFDYLEIEGDNERLGFVIGDAASKGLSAAAQALYTSGAIRMGFEYQTKISSLLSRVNKLLNKTFSEEHFVTLFYGELTDDRNGLVIFANCGHNNPILYRAATGATEFIETTGQIMGPFPNEVFRTENFMMSAGDVLFLYTDGVSEAMDQNEQFYGEERIGQLLREHHTLAAKAITQTVLDDVQKFSSHGVQSDDKTIVTIKRTH